MHRNYNVRECVWVLLLILTALAASAAPAAACGGGVICVDADATGAATGLSWTTAYTNVQDALAAAVSGNEIWVAEGVYYPDEGVEQTDNALTSTFTLRAGVALYGGFAATETLRTQRDWEAHLTVLSGDIDANDWNTDTNRIAETWNDLRGSNAYHVVRSNGVAATARLDGFTITAGNANEDDGGGMYNSTSSPTLTNVAFSGNRATHFGGGMYNASSNPTLTNVTFSGNRATYFGGGMHNNYGSNPILVNCILWGDSATDFPEISNNSSSPTITYSDIQGWSGGGTGNMALDPQFVAPVAASSAPTTTGNYRLLATSSAINVGNTLSVTVSTDLDGNPRVAGGAVDMGAYELQITLTFAKSVTPAQNVAFHHPVTYTISFNNMDVISETDIIFTDTLPAKVTFAHWITNHGAAVNDNELTWNGTLTAATALTFTFVASHTADYGDVVTNTVYISGAHQTGYAAAPFTVTLGHAPVLAAIGPQTVNEMTALTFTVTATDSDLPAQPLTYTLDVGAPAGASLAPTTGLFAWTPTEAQGPGVYTLTARVNDGYLDAAETFTITVGEVNRPPTLWPISGQSVAAGMPVRFVAHATDPDLPAQPLTYTLDAGSVGSITARTGHFTWTASATPGVYTAAVRLTDGEWADAETVAITVTEDTPGIGQWVLAANGSFGDWPFASASNLRIVDTTDDAVYGPFLDGRLGSNSGQRVDVAVTPDGKTALISNFGDATVFLIDVTHPLSPSLITSVTLPFFAEDIAISADGRYALVADGGWSAQLATIDIPAATLVYTADLGTAAAQGVAIAPDGTVIFPNYYGSSIHTMVLEETGVLTYAAGMTQTSTYSYTYPGIPIGHDAYDMKPVNVGIAPDGQTVIVCDATTSTVGIYQIVAPGVLTFTGLVTGAHGTPYEFYDYGGGSFARPGVQSVAFNAAGDKAYLSINNLRTNDAIGTNTGDRVGILAITGPGQVHLEAGGVATVPHQTNGQFLGVDTLVIAGHKAYVGYPSLYGAVDPTTLAVVDLADESVTTTMVFTVDTHIPVGVAAIPQRRLDLHQTVSDPAPLPGQLLTYTLTLRGTGPEISEITLLDVLPPEVDFVGPIAVLPPTAGIAGSAPPTLATHLVVSPTQAVTVTIPVRVRLLPPGTAVQNTARAESFLLGIPASAPRTFTIGCAPTITVQTLNDSGAGSLRWAIAGVCDGGTVDFAAGLAGQTIVLTSEPLTLTRPVTIANPYAPGLRLSGNNATRVFYVPPAVTVTLSSLHIISGTTSSDPMIGYGGGIYNRGTLTVQDCTVSGNTAFFGGGIANGDMGGGVDGTLTLLNSIVASNTATATAGGLFNYGTLLVQNSVISGNVSGGDSGGLCLYSGQATVHHSTIADNRAEGWGGGIWSGVPLTITDSTISGNTALAGGGLQILAIDGTYITNTTISGNRAKQSGGGIGTYSWNSPEIYLSHSTVVSNTADDDGDDDGQGGGLYAYQRAYFLLTHTLVAGNLDMGGQTPECAVVMPEAGRGIYSGGYNLIGDTTGCSLTTHSTDLLNQAALFDALADNGNDTQTHALLPGSPAIDAIPTHSCILAADQRGIARPQGSGCDIGAFESRGFSVTRGGGDQSALVHTAFTAPLLVTVTSAFTEPVDGGRVVFTAPATGASVTFTQSITQTIHNGAASVAATANDHVGAYTVTASTSGAPDVDFTLTNVGYTLTTTITGTGGGSVAVNPEGDYDYGAVVAVTATPLISSTFTGWSGDCSGVGACAVVMTQTRAVTATFAIKHYVLTPTAGTGGAITPATPQTVTYGSALAFAITPETGYHITDVLVDGVSVGARNGYTFTAVTADHTLAATFALNTYVITPTAGTGGAITPATPQTATYGSDLAFAITPETGYHITDVLVDGVSVGARSGYTFTAVTADHTLAATFARNTYTLTVNLVGHGTVTQTPSQTTYLYGDAVTLTATPDAGWRFDGWSGDLESAANPTTLMMDDSKAVTATFTLQPAGPVSYTLTIAVAGDGQGTVTPGVGVHEYLSGTTALVTATAQADSDFAGWNGVCSGASPTCAVTLNADKQLTATFTLKTENAAPIANAGTDLQVEPGAAVTLDGSASGDPEGNLPLTYFWQQAGGPAVSFTPTLSRTMFSAPETPTVLTFTLTVTDSLGLADPTPDTVIITVEPYTIYLPFVLRHQ